MKWTAQASVALCENCAPIGMGSELGRTTRVEWKLIPIAAMIIATEASTIASRIVFDFMPTPDYSRLRPYSCRIGEVFGV